MTTYRSKAGRSGYVEVDFNDEQARRVFVQFADADAKKRADRILKFAQQEAPVGKGPNGGNLRNRIVVSQSRSIQGRYSAGYDVTANTAYAFFVHEGTRPHVIEGKPLLAFFWNVTGAFMVLPRVNHPGTKPNRFLLRALRRAR